MRHLRYYWTMIIIATILSAVSCVKDNPAQNGNQEGIKEVYTTAISFNTRNNETVLFQKELGHPVVITFDVKD